MAVTRRPKREQQQQEANREPIEQAQIDRVINRGGSVPSEQSNSFYEDEQKSVQLRLYQSTIDEIDALRDQVRKGKKPSRHAWLVQAISEKLDRERNVE